MGLVVYYMSFELYYLSYIRPWNYNTNMNNM